MNNLVAAHAARRLKAELKKYLTPKLLVLDELGYLSPDQLGTEKLVRSRRKQRVTCIQP
ncbi:MAG TPA: ATP-binding protein [Verrucomicrobiae bacterium]|nr:ATP-binding protein [Verrucomicrobiae bacterium]